MINPNIPDEKIYFLEVDAKDLLELAYVEEDAIPLDEVLEMIEEEGGANESRS
jgi:hypothetical protein